MRKESANTRKKKHYKHGKKKRERSKKKEKKIHREKEWKEQKTKTKTHSLAACDSKEGVRPCILDWPGRGTTQSGRKAASDANQSKGDARGITGQVMEQYPGVESRVVRAKSIKRECVLVILLRCTKGRPEYKGEVVQGYVVCGALPRLALTLSSCLIALEFKRYTWELMYKNRCANKSIASMSS